MQTLFAGCLVAAPLLLWTAVVYTKLRRPEGKDSIYAALVAAVAWGVFIAVVTELLSLFSALRWAPVALVWSLAVLLSLATWWRIAAPVPTLRPSREGLRSLLSPVAVLLFVTLIVGLVSSPNNWDSMTYHLARVGHWQQNASLSPYPTHELRQLYLAPWAEFALLHLQLLSGGDRLAALVQWLAMAGSLVAVSGVARHLGAGPSSRGLVRLFVITLPMGLLQAVSTQNDWVVSFWVVCAVFFAFELHRELRVVPAVALAASVGLAAMTKATAYLFLTPLVVWLAWRWWRSLPQRAPAFLVLLVALPLLLNASHYLRNWQVFSNPLRPADLSAFEYVNERLSAGVLWSNAVRNAALHLGLPQSNWNAGVETLVRRGHELAGLEIEDPASTWPGVAFGVSFVVQEDLSGNVLHLLLLLLALAVGAVRRGRLRSRLLGYGWLPFVGLLLFCLFLKWQPWHSRLHLPLFVLCSPLLMTLVPLRHRWLSSTVLPVLLVLQALPFLLANPNHPMVGRQSVFRVERAEQYFYLRPGLGEAYRGVAEGLRRAGCRDLGLRLPPDSWEYPLRVLTKGAGSAPLRMQAVDPRNESDRTPRGDFSPCALLCVGCNDEHRARYERRYGEPRFSAPEEKVLLFVRGP